jgi:hypothetical protein
MAGVSPCRKRGQEVAKYRVLVGLDYPPNKRAEAGDEVSDLPSSSITWLLADGLIEAVEGTSKSSKKTVVAPEPEPEPEPVEETIEVIAEESVEEVAE